MVERIIAITEAELPLIAISNYLIIYNVNQSSCICVYTFYLSELYV